MMKRISLKRISKLLMVVALAAGLGIQTVHAATGDIKIVVDGKIISSDVAPVIDAKSNRVLVPMRAIFEALGYKVTWRNGEAFATKETSVILIDVLVDTNFELLDLTYHEWPNAADKTSDNINSTFNKLETYFFFKQPLDNNNPIRNIKGRVMLPTRAIAEATGSNVDWDGKTKTVNIKTDAHKITIPKGWEKAISDHYLQNGHTFEYQGCLSTDGAYNDQYVFNGVSGATSTQPTKPTEALPTPTVQPISPNTPHFATITKVINGKEYQYTTDTNSVIPADTWEDRVKRLQNPTGKVYVAIDTSMHYAYWEYEYTRPSKAIKPIEGSLPGKILIDESKKSLSFQDAGGEWIQNIAPFYKGTGSSTIGGCNWYAESRFWEVNGLPIGHFKKTKAADFFKTSKYLDYADMYEELSVFRDTNDVQENSIAVRTSSSGLNSHVEYVEYVERDGNGKPQFVYVTEANVNNPTGNYRYGEDGKVRKISFEEFKTDGNMNYLGCFTPNQKFFEQ